MDKKFFKFNQSIFTSVDSPFFIRIQDLLLICSRWFGWNEIWRRFNSSALSEMSFEWLAIPLKFSVASDFSEGLAAVGAPSGICGWRMGLRRHGWCLGSWSDRRRHPWLRSAGRVLASSNGTFRERSCPCVARRRGRPHLSPGWGVELHRQGRHQDESGPDVPSRGRVQPGAGAGAGQRFRKMGVRYSAGVSSRSSRDSTILTI